MTAQEVRDAVNKVLPTLPEPFTARRVCVVIGLPDHPTNWTKVGLAIKSNPNIETCGMQGARLYRRVGGSNV